jgi:hypothetical protein
MRRVPQHNVDVYVGVVVLVDVVGFLEKVGNP